MRELLSEQQTHGLGYNTQREQLIIPEYGRNVQQLIDRLKLIEDRQQRTDAAAAIIKIMGDVNGQGRSSSEQLQKLYDKLFIMASFDLDIDSPFPIPEKEVLEQKPDVIAYPHVLNRFRFYGHNVPSLIEKAKALQGEERQLLSITIARHMKKSGILFNKERSDNETIFQHLYDMSNGEIDLKGSDVYLDVSIDPSLQPTPIIGKGAAKLRRKKPMVKRR